MGGRQGKEAGTSSDKTAKDTYEEHVLPHSDELRVLVPDRLWLVKGSLPFPLPRNMLVYRIPATGGILVWSAVAVDEAMLAKIAALGPVEVMVIPSFYHKMDAAVFREKVAPSARVACPASIQSDLPPGLATTTIEEEVDKGTIRAAMSADGMPAGGELALVFDVGGGKAALVLCDLLFNIVDPADIEVGWFGRFVGTHVFGSHGPLHVTKFGKLFFVKDRQALADWLTKTVRETVQDNLGLDLAIISVAHGDPVLSDCYQQLQQAANRLLGTHAA